MTILKEKITDNLWSKIFLVITKVKNVRLIHILKKRQSSSSFVQ